MLEELSDEAQLLLLNTHNTTEDWNNIFFNNIKLPVRGKKMWDDWINSLNSNQRLILYKQLQQFIAKHSQLDEIRIIKGPTPEMIDTLNKRICKYCHSLGKANTAYNRLRRKYKFEHNWGWSINGYKQLDQLTLNKIYKDQQNFIQKYNIPT